jgi:2-dehydro-3-deoxygluconokinase
MGTATRIVRDVPLAKGFDVICAGDAVWKVAAEGVRLRPGGGAVNVAVALAREGLRVGLATVLPDDAFGRSSRATIAAAGVDVGGVTWARKRTGVVLVDATGGANQVPAAAEEEPPIEIPRGWSAPLLLLSGLSPIVSHAAALCKAARAARRAGAFVLLDFNASLHVWAGRDPRTIHMVLRELDAARCSYADLAVLGMDVATVRGTLRQSAVLVVSDDTGRAVATGPFGDVVVPPPETRQPRAEGAGDALTAAIGAELARPGAPGESAAARWNRAIRRARLCG